MYFSFLVNKIRPGLPKHNMSTFVRSSTSRSSLKHRLFAPNPDENEMDDEEDDEEFENYVKKNEIKENSMITSKPETEQEKEESSVKSPTTSSDNNSAADWSTRLIFQCRLCQKQCDGFHMAVSHFKHVHPLEAPGKRVIISRKNFFHLFVYRKFKKVQAKKTREIK